MKKYTVIADSIDHRDWVMPLLNLRLPASVDLRTGMSPVVNQGTLGSCTSNAIASGLREYYIWRLGGRARLSRLFLYWFERQLEGTTNRDSGAMLRDGMKVMHKIGVCPERDCPYIVSKFKTKPSAQAVRHAARFRIHSYHRVPTLQALKTSLAHKRPVVFGLKVYESFESPLVSRTGLVPLPNVYAERMLGGHALLAVGYDERMGRVIVRNSWGSGWGDRGYCYMPYELFESRQLVPDMWTGR